MTEESNHVTSDESPYEAGVVVLAKLKGFPAWPGMIVEETSLDPGIAKAKPKGSSKSSKKGQASGDSGVWPVKFFVDNNFMWATKTELKLLTAQDAEKYLNTTKKKDKLLTAAYQMAANPPDLGSFANPPEPEPQPKDEEPEESLSNGAIAGNGSAKPKKVKKAPVSNTSSTKKIPQTKKKVETKKRVSTSKEDSTNDKKKMKTEKKGSGSAIPSSKQLSRDYESRHKIVFTIRFKLQRGFLSKEPPQEEDIPILSQYLTQLENIEDLELSIIRQTKVNKLLKALLKISDIPLESKFKFHDRSAKLLHKWSTLPDDRQARTSDQVNEEPDRKQKVETVDKDEPESELKKDPKTEDGLNEDDDDRD
jgi:PWWP domain